MRPLWLLSRARSATGLVDDLLASRLVAFENIPLAPIRREVDEELRENEMKKMSPQETMKTLPRLRVCRRLCTQLSCCANIRLH